jgi:hypothetical protein
MTCFGCWRLLAFQNRHKITIKGQTILGESASRDIWVCGAGDFVVLKALAFGIRGEKDAYDLFYLIRTYGKGIGDVLSELKPLLSDPSAIKAMEFKRRDFIANNSLGPRRIAQFLYDRPDPDLEADAAGFIRALLDGI